MKKGTMYNRTEVVENLKVDYFVVADTGFGIGIRETAENGDIAEDIVYDVFPTQALAEEFASTLAAHTVLPVSLRDILRDHLVEKLIS